MPGHELRVAQIVVAEVGGVRPTVLPRGPPITGTCPAPQSPPPASTTASPAPSALSPFARARPRTHVEPCRCRWCGVRAKERTLRGSELKIICKPSGVAWAARTLGKFAGQTRSLSIGGGFALPSSQLTGVLSSVVPAELSHSEQPAAAYQQSHAAASGVAFSSRVERGDDIDRSHLQTIRCCLGGTDSRQIRRSDA